MADNASDVLIVDDEAPIRSLIRFSLQRLPFNIREAGSAHSAKTAIATRKPDILVLDWMLPDMSGIQLIKYLRANAKFSYTPIIMLTARAEEENKLRGLKEGADDYITKPFSPRELAARIEALLRRTKVQQQTILQVGCLRVDYAKHKLYINDQPVHVGRREYQLLSFLMSYPGQVFSRQQLLDRVWGQQAEVTERTVDVHVRRVRKLLSDHGIEGAIATLRGTGYRLEESEHHG